MMYDNPLKGKKIGDTHQISYINPTTGEREYGDARIIGTPDQPYTKGSIANQYSEEEKAEAERLKRFQTPANISPQEYQAMIQQLQSPQSAGLAEQFIAQAKHKYGIGEYGA